jgi:hypothetical protein
MRGGLRFPPFTRPGAPVMMAAPMQDELPSIDLFLDELPPIEDFLAVEEEGEASVSEEAARSEEMPPVSVDGAAEGWASGDWQSYDWNSLSSLNRTAPRTGAAEAWGESEWPGDEMQPRDATQNQTQYRSNTGTPGADEIADALDGIARRLRSGELVIDNLQGTPPEAAMAAALAVLLRMRG